MCTGMFYFLLGNLHPKYRSKLKAIQLLALCKTSYLKKYSLTPLLKHIVDDLKELVRSSTLLAIYKFLWSSLYKQEMGYSFVFGGQSCPYKGTLALISANNPASCALRGSRRARVLFVIVGSVWVQRKK